MTEENRNSSCCGSRTPSAVALGKKPQRRDQQVSATSSAEHFAVPSPSLPIIALTSAPPPSSNLSNRPRLHLTTTEPDRYDRPPVRNGRAATPVERERMAQEVYYANNDSARSVVSGLRSPITYPATAQPISMATQYQNPTSPSSGRYATTPDLLHQKRSPIGRTFSQQARPRKTASRTSSVRRGGGEGVEVDMEDASSRAVAASVAQREGKLSVGIDFG